jgi:hypothetical protein
MKEEFFTSSYMDSPSSNKRRFMLIPDHELNSLDLIFILTVSKWFDNIIRPNDFFTCQSLQADF